MKVNLENNYIEWYPFGALLPNRNGNSGDYRYGFNGMEQDNEVKNITGAHYDFGARVYDSRLGKFMSRDPKWKEYSKVSPYSYAYNNPILFVDKEGEGGWWYLLYKGLYENAKSTGGVFTAEIGTGAGVAVGGSYSKGMAVDHLGNIGVYTSKAIGIESGAGVSVGVKTENLMGYKLVTDMVGEGYVVAADVGLGKYLAVGHSIEMNKDGKPIGHGGNVDFGFGDPIPAHLSYEFTITSMVAMSYEEYEKFSLASGGVYKLASKYAQELNRNNSDGNFYYGSTTTERIEDFRPVYINGKMQYWDKEKTSPIYEQYVGVNIGATPMGKNVTYEKFTLIPYYVPTGVYFRKDKNTESYKASGFKDVKPEAKVEK